MATLNHWEPDMVQIDLGGNQSGIRTTAYKYPLEYLSIEDKDIRYSDFVQQLTCPCEELLKRLNIDIRWLCPTASLLPADYTPQVEDRYQ
nr:hypothetical protein [Candidatus Njordarchaeota archaeon]